MSGESKRAAKVALIDAIERWTGGTVVHWNDGEGHRQVLLWNRRYERAFNRSRRNQPPRSNPENKEQHHG